LKALKSRDEARRFLRAAVKALVVFALKNPGVLQDLKSRDCPEQTGSDVKITEWNRLADMTARQMEAVHQNVKTMQKLFGEIERQGANG
jgi:hypothetical protein